MAEPHEGLVGRSAPREESALTINRALVFDERPMLGHVNLRGASGDERFADALASVLGIALPLTPNTFSEVRDTTVCWLGPDEWRVTVPRERVADTVRELRSACSGTFAAVTDVSGGLVVLVLRGSAAREVLAKGCPVDLDTRAFVRGRCVQSHLAKAPVLICQVDAEPAFEIVVRRSLSSYLRAWLRDAMQP